MLQAISPLLDRFIADTKEAFGSGLTGVYLHGSAAMGCFNPKQSDIDLIVVVRDTPTFEEKLDFLKRLLVLNRDAPEKGIEMSVLTEEACRHFVYPTPFELHFSNAHLTRAAADLEGFVRDMHGTDSDLAAHCKILYHRGLCLYGSPIREVFAEPAARDYLASIEADAADAADGIAQNPVYGTLNLLRVLAFKERNLLLSKREGGDWGLSQSSLQAYHPLIRKALDAYVWNIPFDDPGVTDFAAYMLDRLQNSALMSRRSWFRTPHGIEICYEDRVVRVRADSALYDQLQSGKSFTKQLIAGYQQHEGKPLQISVRSLQGELRLHYIADQWFIALARFFKHPRFLHRFFEKMHLHTYQIDCGERSVDGNRLLFDLLGVFFGK